ncbi:MAG: DUF4373 domain-containing protein [Ignavibacteria bacterium]|nr:DUF4373 domain-containing protein [Ignavibacteria bacterium]
MARPLKTGLEYFSHDVSLSSDDKVQFIEAKHGIIGYAVFCKLLEKIYKNGYYAKWEQRDEILFAKTNSLDVKAVKEIVSDCINEGLFSAKLYNEHNVLTSRSIQLRYILGSQKRKNIYLINDFLCVSETEASIHVKVTLTGITGEIIEVISPESTQSKVKESKEKKSRGEETPPRNFLKISFDEFYKTFLAERDFNTYEKYDLEIYFSQAVEKYPSETSIAEIIKRVKKFIGCDINSSGKFSPHLKKIITKDSVTVAYELVKNNLDWIKNLPDKNPDEVVPELIKKCRNPARNDALFEAYVEKALKYYVSTE